MKKQYYAAASIFLSLFALTAAPAWTQEAASSSSAPALSRPAKPDKALRVFLKSGSKKTYVRGYQWMTLDLNRKINLVESARRGALKMGALMTQPAEVYIRNLDQFYAGHPTLMSMEIGQVIQGTAISMKDWDDGTTGAKQ
jgi:hypothetical protein